MANSLDDLDIQSVIFREMVDKFESLKVCRLWSSETIQ